MVKNIGLENVDVKGRIIVGGLVGTIKSGGKVEKSYVTGKVSSKEESVGGIAGQNKGMIKESYSTALVTTNKKTAGGITGLNDGEDALIENSYSTGAVESEDIFGGLVGLNSKGAELKNTYTTGKVEDNANIVLGAFVGSNTAKKEDGKISGKNYWKKGTGAKAVAKGVGYGPENNVEEKTEAELKALTASDTKWDTAIWDFKAGEYPKLKWQSE